MEAWMIETARRLAFVLIVLPIAALLTMTAVPGIGAEAALALLIPIPIVAALYLIEPLRQFQERD